MSEDKYEFKDNYIERDYKDAHELIVAVDGFDTHRLDRDECALLHRVVLELGNYKERLIELDKLQDTE